ncbi:MAG: 5-formyltetrahydrofolate cyclo-ligase [Pacificimonas sp.]|jgi:5-formyltetrahydrofolate cyclo-ligase|nr:5-formyltetrahydrofolate cyclo-ligase [Pacificimonas sp.]
MPDVLADKAQLRRTFREVRSAFVSDLAEGEARRLSSAAMAQAAPHLAGHAVIGLYAATPEEIDPLSAAPASATVALPWFAARDDHMYFRETGALERGPWGIRQAVSTSPLAEPTALIVPLVAATRTGHRLGQGGGHYDRYLARRGSEGTRPLTIGLAWDCQLTQSLPVDPWDEPLNFIATPSALYAAP